MAAHMLTISRALRAGRSPLPADLAKPSDLKEVRPQILMLREIGSGLEVCDLGPEAADRALCGDQESAI